MAKESDAANGSVTPESPPPMHPMRAIAGSVISAFFGVLAYRLTQAIAVSFASHPLTTPNMIARNLSAAVRTLVIGLTSMATGIFVLVAVGLVALSLQLLIQRLRSPNPET